MHVINARNVNDAFAQGCAMMLNGDGIKADSRNGPVVEFGPVTTVYEAPCERVLWDGARDANPFFHLFESLWMLAGRNDIAYVSRYAKRMATFSDDGITQWGAYGYRWRRFFNQDQLNTIILELQQDPTSRRAVLGMWSPSHDLGLVSKDLPCNLNAKFEVRHGKLNMIVFNRSNDMIWGAYGANAVHFSMLQEYMAARLKLDVGRYWQVSGNFHVYVKVWEEVLERSPNEHALGIEDCYQTEDVSSLPLVTSATSIDDEITAFMHGSCATGNVFLDSIARHLDDIWSLWLHKDRARAHVEILKLPPDNDWVHACRRWMERRIMKAGQ